MCLRLDHKSLSIDIPVFKIDSFILFLVESVYINVTIVIKYILIIINVNNQIVFFHSQLPAIYFCNYIYNIIIYNIINLGDILSGTLKS